jgi:hypothetical protein
MRRKHETIKGHNISVWDDGPNGPMDRYTVVYLDDVYPNGKVDYLAMNAYPFHPQGFGQHGEMDLNAVAYKGRGGAFARRMKFEDLPDDCKRAVKQDLGIE